jgi:hypothetical protein
VKNRLMRTPASAPTTRLRMRACNTTALFEGLMGRGGACVIARAKEPCLSMAVVPWTLLTNCARSSELGRLRGGSLLDFEQLI